MPIARYTQTLMDQLMDHGECVQHFTDYSKKGKTKASSRIRNAAFRLGVKVTTQVHDGYIIGKVVK